MHVLHPRLPAGRPTRIRCSLSFERPLLFGPTRNLYALLMVWGS